MKKILIIPDRNNLTECLELAEQYQLGFEYNDFTHPDVLDDEQRVRDIVEIYKSAGTLSYCTMHGAFYDVIPFSLDKRIRETADLRINQSIEAARKIGAKAVVFHTNYDPFLNSVDYVRMWIDSNAKYWSGVLSANPDMNIYLENMFDTSPDIMEQLSERLCVHENYGVCLDWAHASLSNTEPRIWAKKLGRYVKHVHINDNDNVSDLHLAWGDGKVKRDKFYECYKEYFSDATVLIETNPMEYKKRSLELLMEEGFMTEDDDRR